MYDDLNYSFEDIAEERLDVNILDRTLSKTLHLYHGSYLKNLLVIAPNSMNVGNRISRGQRRSSFWTRDFDYAAIWAMDYIAWAILEIPYCHYIEKKYFIIPNWENKNGVHVYDLFLKKINEMPVYVYEAIVPTKIVSRGQLPIDEYTVDVSVKPIKCTKIGAKEAKKYLVVSDNDDFKSISNLGVYSKIKTSIPEKLIFGNPRDAMKRRSAAIDREMKEREQMKEMQIATASYMGYNSQ